ncbi:winged helix-turn-helix domain-containing protein [Peribacillus frigoritolerans]|nr:winged helix-turn-helix domain-containing protein [Peribacillus frigoritolerans]
MDHLISEIKSGTFQLDKKLPSEHILADQFNVPRMVVRKAYEQLQDLGFIYSKQGKGKLCPGNQETNSVNSIRRCQFHRENEGIPVFLSNEYYFFAKKFLMIRRFFEALRWKVMIRSLKLAGLG